MLAQELNLALQKLCGFPGVLSVINTRVRFALKGAAHVHLAPLGPEAATDLLRDRCGAAWDSSAAAALTQMCGGNPLGLCMMGSFIASRRCTMQVSRGTAL